ncbi:hypothetical protein CVT24_001113 [Panaeolus cyanescens]|uniref:Vacuolar protein-sorting-associated protein 36 n=1 Tax=Panaeolus cyanescens TaxID=181874 RepID=A0A409YZC1_9AGAR|nr:hypothetical protein CVT24_001113 [Panaeolus cyanescens]
MALRKYTQHVDGTIPVPALLYDDEELQSSQENVGIYDGSQKSPNHQQGTIHITSHRLFYIDGPKPATHSFHMDLACITQTEHYAGLFKSSPKVTCHLSGHSVGSVTASSNADSGNPHAPYGSWECEVCAYRNPPGLSPAAASICGLCGVPRTAVPQPVNLDPSQKSQQKQHLSTSLPSSVSSTPAPGAWNSEPQPLSPTNRDSIACPACTFLNHHSMRQCELCSADLPRPRRELKSAPTSRPLTPGSEDEDDGSPNKMIKISFRKGGDKPFYALLKRSLKAKAWEVKGTSGRGLSHSGNSSDPDNRNNLGMTGISGILRTVENTQKGTETVMTDALQDLEALMVKAKDMVKLAAELNEKLTAVTSSAQTQTGASTAYSSTSTLVTSEPEEATFIRSSLSQLGLQMSNAPVTLDMMKDERRWFEELARELARVLQGGGTFASMSIRDRDRDTIGGGMMKERGIIALDEVWGGWNRARGVALIPPATLLQVLPLLPNYTSPPITHRAFPSGLNVLHTPPYSSKAFSSRLISLLQGGAEPEAPNFAPTYTPKTITEIADAERLPVGLVDEMVHAVEDEMGGVCRDDGDALVAGSGSGPYGGGSAAETMWWPNVFVGYIWDGQE